MAKVNKTRIIAWYLNTSPGHLRIDDIANGTLAANTGECARQIRFAMATEVGAVNSKPNFAYKAGAP